MTRPDRAVAIVVCNARVLVVLRRRPGRSYAVLPGGGVEPGESPAQAAVRELAEETSLIGIAGEQLWVRDDGGRRAFYLRMREVTGTPRLGGPEAARQSADNQYGLVWASADELENLGLRPAEIAPLMRELLQTW